MPGCGIFLDYTFEEFRPEAACIRRLELFGIRTDMEMAVKCIWWMNRYDFELETFR